MIEYKTSVIIPVYNTEMYLDECLQSVLNQTQEEVEIIVVDDGSTDNSSNIIEEYAKKYSNIFVYHQENKKLGAARNYGMQKARGQYIFFLDSDDSLKSDSLEYLYELAKKNDLDVITFDADVINDMRIYQYSSEKYNRGYLSIDEKKIWSGKSFFKKYFTLGGVYASACLQYIKREFLNENKIYFEEQVFYEDNDFTFRVYLNAEKLMYCSKKFYNRRYRENSIITSKYNIHHLNGALKASTLSIHYMLQNMFNYDFHVSFQTYCSSLISLLYKVVVDIKLENNKYFQEFFEILLKLDDCIVSNFMCGLAEDYLSFITYLLKRQELSIQVKQKLEQVHLILEKRMRAIAIKVVGAITQYEEEKKICIYGCGKIADKVFEFIRNYCPNLIENVIFAKTIAKENEKYRDLYDIKSIEQIKDENIGIVIIASSIYEREILDSLQRLYKNNYKYYSYRYFLELV